MNNIGQLSFEKCTGCNACVQICPKHCIGHEIKDGFWYPTVEEQSCIECARCVKACPAIEPLDCREPLACYAGYNTNDDVRRKSSSGGIFWELAKTTISKGGVVFGAVFDEKWHVVHKSAKLLEEVAPMLGSKYLQCDTRNTFQECKEYLKQDKYVLYSGTPCQIEGLHKFLGKSYENLFTLDFICHGVPSPGIWQRYLDEKFGGIAAVKAADGKNTVLNSSLNAMSPIGDIKFRDKTDGWEKYRFVVLSKSASKADKNSVLLSDIYSKNPYMQGFLNDLYLRESCYHCPARSFASRSDMTIGDFWGVHSLKMDDMNDQKGLSIITINSDKGKASFLEISSNLIFRELSFLQAVESNSNLVNIAKKNIEKVDRFNKYAHMMPLVEAINKTLYVSLVERISLKIKNKIGFIK